MTHSVLGTDGGFTERGSAPGPLCTELRDEKHAQRQADKARKIAAEASCIGCRMPARR